MSLDDVDLLWLAIDTMADAQRAARIAAGQA